MLRSHCAELPLSRSVYSVTNNPLLGKESMRYGATRHAVCTAFKNSSKPRDEMTKSRKPLTDREKFRNLWNELAKGVLDDDTPLSQEEEAELREYAAKLEDFTKSYMAWVNEGKPLWGERALEKKKRSGDGHDR